MWTKIVVRKMENTRADFWALHGNEEMVISIVDLHGHSSAMLIGLSWADLTAMVRSLGSRWSVYTDAHSASLAFINRSVCGCRWVMLSEHTHDYGLDELKV